ncbi:MAG: hypothetical protein LBU74_04345 [Methanobacteriaceae archaeon]|jgi:uncharacterized coiled-coil DUF342 family protein|nr:hypothetical protein [Candidatus Methanorudis spinitermitis]
MNEKDKIIKEKSKTKDYINKTSIVLKEKNNFEEVKSLKKKLNKKNKELEKSKKTLNFQINKEKQCEQKISLIINEKNELLEKIHQLELMKLDLKLQKSNDLKEKIQKAEHRINITKKLLDDSKEEIAMLKNIIDGYEKLGFFDFIRNKKPDSVRLYNNKFENK